MDKQKPEIGVISSLNNFDIKDLQILIWESTLDTKEINIAIIGVDAYCATCTLKKAQVFAISMENLEYQAKKEARPETNLKSILSEEYHDFLNLFSKKNSNKLPPHQKYDHKIILEEQ